jgi:hypothetical protein
MIDAAVVWNAYRALHRYMVAPQGTLRVGATWVVPATGKPAALAKGEKITDLGPTPSGPMEQEAAEEIAQRLAPLLHTMPLPITDDYYAYLYLFAQLIRVSFDHHPFHVTTEIGWRNLVWRPLRVLRGKSGGESAQAYWAKWYYTHAQAATPKPTEASLRLKYPVAPDQQEQTADMLELQLDALLDAMARYGLGAGQVFLTCDRLGQPGRNASKNLQWLPLLIAARPEAYHPLVGDETIAATTPEVWAIITKLLASPKDLGVFFEHTVPFCNPGPEDSKALREHLLAVRAAITTGFAGVVEQRGDSARTKLWQKRRAELNKEDAWYE